jgi:hypothetical protein
MQKKEVLNGTIKYRAVIVKHLILAPSSPKQYICAVCNKSTSHELGSRERRATVSSPLLHLKCERYVPKGIDIVDILETSRITFRNFSDVPELTGRNGFIIPDGLYTILQIANMFYLKDTVPNIDKIQQDIYMFANLRSILYSCISDYTNIMPCHDYCIYGPVGDKAVCGRVNHGAVTFPCTIFNNMFKEIFGTRKFDKKFYGIPVGIEPIRLEPIPPIHIRMAENHAPAPAAGGTAPQYNPPPWYHAFVPTPQYNPPWNQIDVPTTNITTIGTIVRT